MHKALTYLSTAGLAALVSAPVYATPGMDGVYTSISGDYTWLHSNTNGGGGNIAVGDQFLTNNLGDFRIEAEAGYHDFSDAHYFTYMGNLYYDLNALNYDSSSLKIVPYVGAGLGDATIHMSNSDFAGRYTEQGDAFAYQFMGGLGFTSANMPNAVWSVGYRYLASDDISGTDNIGLSNSERLHANNIELAARFSF